MPDSAIFKEIQKSERRNRKTISKCSFGVSPAWIGDTPETPALNLFTNLFISSFKLLLKASPPGCLPRSTKLLAATGGWPSLNLVLPWVFLTHLPPQWALSLVLHSQGPSFCLPSWHLCKNTCRSLQFALIPVTCLTYIWFWYFIVSWYIRLLLLFGHGPALPYFFTSMLFVWDTHNSGGLIIKERKIVCLCPSVDSIRTPFSML